MRLNSRLIRLILLADIFPSLLEDTACWTGFCFTNLSEEGLEEVAFFAGDLIGANEAKYPLGKSKESALIAQLRSRSLAELVLK